MNMQGVVPLLQSWVPNANCCQPWHPDAPLQTEVLKKFVLSWSEKLLSPLGSLSLVTPVTLSKDPTADDMVPDDRAEKSLPLPTVSGLGPRAGGNGRVGPVVQGTSCHSMLG
jgi:hypothetical protein